MMTTVLAAGTRVGDPVDSDISFKVAAVGSESR
ncbi:hypothetical protein F4557_000181 [Actinomadura catellatispora]|uniref:Uncharacterized protein n=1 Tax=Actinomadura livida TaxID=79909 RepID=A0A7W7I7B0_9ACTN|nr:hypothetical protein [Actinomadura catellatispora]